MPLSTEDFLLTHMVVDGEVDPEPVAIAIGSILEASPCGEDPGWSDIVVERGGAAFELTIATPFGELVPVARDE